LPIPLRPTLLVCSKSNRSLFHDDRLHADAENLFRITAQRSELSCARIYTCIRTNSLRFSSDADNVRVTNVCIIIIIIIIIIISSSSSIVVVVVVVRRWLYLRFDFDSTAMSRYNDYVMRPRSYSWGLRNTKIYVNVNVNSTRYDYSKTHVTACSGLLHCSLNK